MREYIDLTVFAYEGAEPLEGVHIRTISNPRGRLDRYYRSAASVASAIKRDEFDLVHAHGDDFLIRSRAPVVRSFYGSSWNEALSSSGLRRANHFVLAATELISARRAELRLGIAPESSDRFNCQYDFPPYLPTGATHHLDKTADPSVVFIGSFFGRKRGSLVQAAVEELRSSIPRLSLDVIGPADDAARWAPWVRHHSGASDSEVTRIVTAGWVLAAPSLYEGFGIPMLEALDAGTAVIASRNPGSSYLKQQSNEALPLTLATDAEFPGSLGRRLEAGPDLGPAERAAAEQLVAQMAYLGSPEKLLSHYREAAQRARVKR